MLDFASVKNIVIPEGNVRKIEYNGTVLWKGFTNLIPKATFDNDLFSIVETSAPGYTEGYADGYRWSLSGGKVSVLNNGKNIGRITGLIPYKAGKWRVKNICYSNEVQSDGNSNYSGIYGYTIYVFKDGSVEGMNTAYQLNHEINQETSLITFDLLENNDIESVFFSGFKHNNPPIVTINEEII